MHSTVLRLQHLHGLLAGVAIGDALGCTREGLKRRVALRMFGRPPLRYRLLPGRGIYSDDTQIMLIATQSMLQCRSDLSTFRRVFQSRMKWYPLSLPVGIGWATSVAALKCWFWRLGLPTGVRSAGSGAATRAMFCALALNNNGHRLRKWVEDVTKITHTHPLAIDGCQVLAQLAEIAATNPMDKLDVAAALKQCIAASSEPELRDGLTRLIPYLDDRRSPTYVARQFGWSRGIRGNMVPTTIMAAYCWLRYPRNYRRAVESAICLGGDADSLGAIVGGLVGAHIGIKRLPPELLRGLTGLPQGPKWIEEMATRLADWPHGMHDLSMAPPQSSEPILQLVRNSFSLALFCLHVIGRIPCCFFTRSTPAHLRRRRRQRKNGPSPINSLTTSIDSAATGTESN